MKLLLITFFLLALGFAGIAIKIWAKKNGEFSGTCASQNSNFNEKGEPCGFCGKNAGRLRRTTSIIIIDRYPFSDITMPLFPIHFLLY